MTTPVLELMIHFSPGKPRTCPHCGCLDETSYFIVYTRETGRRVEICGRCVNELTEWREGVLVLDLERGGRMLEACESGCCEWADDTP